ncbi:hypothetical protein E3P92_03588 [Wallemia ichthyophaga]|uniref:Uncharacterized protein n=2 Tax=Wallemia ichthyophaga TaxID=245174 RepID=R9AFY7_WALI9|nr:uncharacterized protein J056_004434 [Wallemia ichthyophaga EXF-994]EOR01113.1 hypothetical protein J056_004434 [Wallemia ichthyophaga EXF-994]TIB09091.1 hypothetical protein E3P92_03588 [Wallemia ichthyophaga]
MISSQNQRRSSSGWDPKQSERRRSSIKALAKPSVQQRPSKPEGPNIPADKIKMIISDVDGTLFDDDHGVHPRVIDCFKWLRANKPEIPILPVTGKQLVSINDMRIECDLLDMPVGACHGAIIYNPDGTVQSQQKINKNTVLSVVDMMMKHNKTCMLYEHDKVHCVSLEERPDKDFFEISKGFDPSISDKRGTDFLEKVDKEEVVICKIFCPMEETVIEDFMTLLLHEPRFPRDSFKLTRALPYIIELCPPGVDKAVALAHFCKVYGIAPENTITFGDGENDVGMFKASGFSCSMGNAMKAPRENCTHRTLTNNEGGVGVFLDSIFRPDYQPPKDQTSAIE